MLTTRTGHPEPMVPGLFLVGRCLRRAAGLSSHEHDLILLLNVSFARIRKCPPWNYLPRFPVSSDGINAMEPSLSTPLRNLWGNLPPHQWPKTSGWSQFWSQALIATISVTTTATAVGITAVGTTTPASLNRSQTCTGTTQSSVG